MATVTATQPMGLAAVSRAVVAAAAELVAGVQRAMISEDKIRTARGNAWAAIQADRARAQARAEMDALVRALMTEGPRTAAAVFIEETAARSAADRSAAAHSGRPATLASPATSDRPAASARAATSDRPAAASRTAAARSASPRSAAGASRRRPNSAPRAVNQRSPRKAGAAQR